MADRVHAWSAYPGTAESPAATDCFNISTDAALPLSAEMRTRLAACLTGAFYETPELPPTVPVSVQV